MYLFLSLKWWQSSILWSVLCRLHSLYHCSHLLSLIAIRCHSLSLVVPLLVTRCTIHCHSLSFVVTVAPCYSMYHSSVFNSQFLYDLKPMAHLTKTSVSFLLKFTFFKTKRMGSLRSFIKRQTSDTSSDSEWQQVTTSGTTSDNEWQRVTTNDNEWYNEWQRETTSDNTWQRVTTSGHFV